jgi:hypothetical protein
LFGKPEGKRPLGIPVRILKDNRIDLEKNRVVDVDWIHLAQGMVQWRTVVNTVPAIERRIP